MYFFKMTVIYRYASPLVDKETISKLPIIISPSIESLMVRMRAGNQENIYFDRDRIHEDIFFTDPAPNFADKSTILTRKNDGGALIKCRRYFCYTQDLNSKPVIWKECCVVIACKGKEEFDWLMWNPQEPEYKRHEDPELNYVIWCLKDYAFAAGVEESYETWKVICSLESMKNLQDIKKCLPLSQIRFIYLALHAYSLECHVDDFDKTMDLATTIYELSKASFK